MKDEKLPESSPRRFATTLPYRLLLNAVCVAFAIFFLKSNFPNMPGFAKFCGWFNLAAISIVTVGDCIVLLRRLRSSR